MQKCEWDKAEELVVTADEREDLAYLKGRQLRLVEEARESSRPSPFPNVEAALNSVRPCAAGGGGEEDYDLNDAAVAAQERTQSRNQTRDQYRDQYRGARRPDSTTKSSGLRGHTGRWADGGKGMRRLILLGRFELVHGRQADLQPHPSLRPRARAPRQCPSLYTLPSPSP